MSGSTLGGGTIIDKENVTAGPAPVEKNFTGAAPQKTAKLGKRPPLQLHGQSAPRQRPALGNITGRTANVHTPATAGGKAALKVVSKAPQRVPDEMEIDHMSRVSDFVPMTRGEAMFGSFDLTRLKRLVVPMESPLLKPELARPLRDPVHVHVSAPPVRPPIDPGTPQQQPKNRDEPLAVLPEISLE